MSAVQDVSSAVATALRNARSKSSSLDDVTSPDNVISLTLAVKHWLLKCPFFLHLWHSACLAGH